MSRREEFLQDIAESHLLEQRSISSRIWTALPAIVQAIDYQKFTISAQPAIRGQIEDENGNVTDVDLPLLVDVPVLMPNAGGWHLTFPIKVDDEVLIIFASRCIDAWWQSGGVQKAIENRMHDLSDGFAVLAPYSQKLAPDCKGGISDSSVILRDDEKKNFLEITNEGKLNLLHQSDLDSDTLGNAEIYIKGNAHVQIDGNLKTDVTGNIDVSAQAVTLRCSSLTVDSPISTFTGNVQVNKTLTASNDCIGGGISLKSHVHGGVKSGPSTTGGPQ